MDAYTAYLLALATSRQYRQPDDIPSIPDPTAFFVSLLKMLDDMDTTLTGMNAFADAVFAHPDFASLLQHADNRQSDIYQRISPHVSALMMRYWEQIIVPAWNQYAVTEE
jgi:hypothetical protein